MDGDVGGIAVHIAARVGALAGAGEVLVTSTVKDLLAGSGSTLRSEAPPDSRESQTGGGCFPHLARRLTAPIIPPARIERGRARARLYRPGSPIRAFVVRKS
jgi:hypothetical protein